MTFLAPEGLLALLAVPALLLLRLAGARRRARIAGSLLLWRRAAAGRPAERGSRLPPPADLALEAAALAAAALALGDPASPRAEAGETRLVVVLDRTASMAARAPDGRTAWDRALSALEARLGGVPPGARVTLVAVPGIPGGVVEGPPLEVLRAARTAGPAASSGDLLAARLPSRDDRTVLLVTDRLPALAAGDPTEVLAAGVPLPNAAVTALRAERADGALRVFAAVANLSEAAADLRLSVRVADPEGPGTDRALRCGPGEEVGVTLEIPGAAGAHAIVAIVSPGGALDVDDRLRAPVGDGRTGPVVWNGPDAPALRRALRAALGPATEFAAGAPADAALHVFHREVPPTLPDGPTLLVDPVGAPPGLDWTVGSGAPVAAAGPWEAALRATGLPAAAPAATGASPSPPAGAEVLLRAGGRGAVAFVFPRREGPLAVVGLPAAGGWQLAPAYPVFWGRLVRRLVARTAGTTPRVASLDRAESDLRAAGSGHREGTPGPRPAPAAPLSGRPLLAWLAAALLALRLSRRA
ncbi:MAG: BatA domain-containing protein [Planctomycetales bacterium]|nr:BatA domain-containing protein [Planctomycetales bacterium]